MSKRSRRSKAISRKRLSLKQVGTLAAAASLATVCEGYAHIVYVPVNDVLSLGEIKSYDLDGDSQSDIYFDALGINSNMGAYGASCPSGTFTAKVVVDEYYSSLFAHQNGDTIGLSFFLSGSGFLNVDFYDQSPPRCAGFYFYPGCDSLPHWGLSY